MRGTLRSLTFLLLLGALVWACTSIEQTSAAPHQAAKHALPLILNTSNQQNAEPIQGGPSLSAAFVDRVLAVNHSPAQGIGPELYQLSMQYHIDDSFALSFFHHESSYGTKGVAVYTHSWGNIRCTKGWTCDPTRGYRAYQSYADAAKDWYALLATAYIPQGFNTVSSIIPVYAPASDDNDEAAYIHSILADVTAFRQGRITA